MVRVRVNVIHHDGTSHKDNLWKCLYVTDVYVYKVIETREGFVLLTDLKQVDRLLSPANIDKFKEHNLDIRTPPEYRVSRTLLLRGVDPFISQKTAEEIEVHLGRKYPLYEVYKIPNNPRLIKIICPTRWHVHLLPEIPPKVNRERSLSKSSSMYEML